MRIRKVQVKHALQREQRERRIRSRLFGTSERPRLSVFRSNRFIYAELIDDTRGATLVQANEMELRVTSQKPAKKRTVLATKKLMSAYKVGELIAKRAKEKNITRALFDRGRYHYHGKVKALAEGARAGGLSFLKYENLKT